MSFTEQDIKYVKFTRNVVHGILRTWVDNKQEYNICKRAQNSTQTATTAEEGPTTKDHYCRQGWIVETVVHYKAGRNWHLKKSSVVTDSVTALHSQAIREMLL